MSSSCTRISVLPGEVKFVCGNVVVVVGGVVVVVVIVVVAVVVVVTTVALVVVVSTVVEIVLSVVVATSAVEVVAVVFAKVVVVVVLPTLLLGVEVSSDCTPQAVKIANAQIRQNSGYRRRMFISVTSFLMCWKGRGMVIRAHKIRWWCRVQKGRYTARPVLPVHCCVKNADDR